VIPESALLNILLPTDTIEFLTKVGLPTNFKLVGAKFDALSDPPFSMLWDTARRLEPVMHFGICAQQWLKTVQWLTHSHLKSAKFAFFGLTMSYLDLL